MWGLDFIFWQTFWILEVAHPDERDPLTYPIEGSFWKTLIGVTVSVPSRPTCIVFHERRPCWHAASCKEGWVTQKGASGNRELLKREREREREQPSLRKTKPMAAGMSHVILTVPTPPQSLECVEMRTKTACRIDNPKYTTSTTIIPIQPLQSRNSNPNHVPGLALGSRRTTGTP